MDPRDKQTNCIVKENLGMADYDNSLFRLTIKLETVDTNNEPVHELVTLRLNEYPMSYVELLHAVPILYGAMYDEASQRRRELPGSGATYITSEALADLNMEYGMTKHFGYVFETLTEHTDSLKLEYDEQGEIENR